jgi:aspartyl aminopeptidase
MAALLLGASACGAAIDQSDNGATPTASQPTAPAPAPSPATPAAKSNGNGAAKSGWALVSPAERTHIERVATNYLAFLGEAKTSRRAIAQLAARIPGARQLTGAPIRAPAGTRLWLPGPGGKAAAFVLVGSRPIEEGARIIVVSVDAPRIDLKQKPVYSKNGFAMLDTFLYGPVRLASWLVHPLTLDLYADRPGAKAGPARLRLGDKPGDPVLTIPDLLPHLSRKVQRPAVVDSPERLDALAASSQRALHEYLHRQGIDPAAFASAEVSLVPAAKPIFVGVDRALLSGYGHTGRALAFAAMDALASAKQTHHTAIVIAIDGRENGYQGSAGRAFVGTALTTIFSALASKGAAADILTTRRIHARSAVLMASPGGGKRNAGLVINPTADDSLPVAVRRVLDSLHTSATQYQITNKRRSAPARGLGTLDIDVVGVGLPISGHGTPNELLSTLDLYQARKAFAGWLLRK